MQRLSFCYRSDSVRSHTREGACHLERSWCHLLSLPVPYLGPPPGRPDAVSRAGGPATSVLPNSAGVGERQRWTAFRGPRIRRPALYYRSGCRTQR